ncbi:hypothetical protein LXL04_009098 [Taraxacum kok-saghyz]
MNLSTKQEVIHDDIEGTCQRRRQIDQVIVNIIQEFGHEDIEGTCNLRAINCNKEVGAEWGTGDLNCSLSLPYNHHQEHLPPHTSDSHLSTTVAPHSYDHHHTTSSTPPSSTAAPPHPIIYDTPRSGAKMHKHPPSLDLEIRVTVSCIRVRHEFTRHEFAKHEHDTNYNSCLAYETRTRQGPNSCNT